MGRTNPTYRQHVRRLNREWGKYRRTLRRQDQPHFDRLFEHAETYADAGSQLNTTDPVVPVLFSIMLAQEKRIAALEAAASPAVGTAREKTGGETQ